MIISSVSNIQELRYLNYEDLVKIKGVGMSKACSLLAAIELGNRINTKINSLNNVKFEDVGIVYEYYKNKIGYLKQEVFCVVYLDSKNMIIKEKELFKGTLNFSMVHPREIFKEAYMLSASKFICLHNHPSGDVTPSNEDIFLTKNLIEISYIQGITFLDHLIISNNKYYSFYNESNLFNK